jgi:histidinol-phosphate phosphatase family protein
MRKAVFLDRDGVICENRDDYVKSWREFVWISGATEAISLLKDNGYLIIVATNQSAIGRGIISSKMLGKIHNEMLRQIIQAGGKIDRIYCCPHRPTDGCSCRKPKPGLLLQASRDFNINVADSYLVGDSFSDVIMGQRVGCTTIIVKTGKGAEELASLSRNEIKPHYIAPNLLEAVRLILRLDS